MSRSAWTPSIVPGVGEQTVYLVLDCFGKIGCAWRETDIEDADLETVIADLMAGQYEDPQRVIAFNTAERWSEDVSRNIAREIRRRSDLAGDDVSSAIEDFVARYDSPERQLALRLV